jgi:hypothetical protein
MIIDNSPYTFSRGGAFAVAICNKTTKTAWDEARTLLKAVGTSDEILTSLDQVVQRTKSRAVFVADYCYSDLIVDRGRFVAPCHRTACDSCAELVQATAYSCIPLTFLASQSVEIFIDYSGPDERSAPLRMMRPGETFGVFEILDLILSKEVVEPIWSVAAGARSIHVIAPLGNRSLPQWIRTKIGRQVTWTKKSPHWQLVKESANSNWTTKVVILPGDVIQKIRQSDRFFEFLLATGWVQSRSLRNSMVDDANLRGIVGAEVASEPAPLGELYHYATLRHLLSLSKGSLPSFVSSNTLKEPSGPFEEFCAILSDALEKNTDFTYEPLVMQPSHVEPGSRSYYSMRCPSMPGPSPEGVNTYAMVVSALRNVLDRLKTEPWSSLASTTRFFVKECDFAKYPGIYKADKLKAESFLLPSKAAAEIYFDSPFFVAGVELCVAVHESRTAIGNEREPRATSDLRREFRKSAQV